MPLTGTDGKVQIEVVPGNYTVTAVRTGYRTATQDALGIKDAEVRLLPISLAAQIGTLAVTVTDNRTGAPLAGVDVTAAPKV